MREEEPPTPLRSRGTSQTLIFLHGRRRILPNVSQSVPIGNWAFCAHFPIFSKIFFGSRKKIKIFGVRKKLDMYFDSNFHDLSNGAIFRPIPALLHAVWERWKKITEFWTTLGIICYHSKKSLLYVWVPWGTPFLTGDYKKWKNERIRKSRYF